MCQRNWPKYNASLVQRGSLSFFCNRDVISLLRQAKTRGRGVGRPAYPNELILILLMLKTAYSLSYRACEGMARSLFNSHGILVPCYTTICRAMQRIVDYLPALSKRNPKIALIDSSGFKIFGEGEWKVKAHGKSYRRGWSKVHVVVDSATGEIVDFVVDTPAVGDSTVGIRLLHRLSKATKTVLCDGAYDGRPFREQAEALALRALIPPPRNAKLSDDPYMQERNDALRVITGLGNDLRARSIWAKSTGYNHRVKVESAFSRLKRVFSDRLFSRSIKTQLVEIWTMAALSNIWLNWAS